MAKYLRVTMPDGSKWDVPLDIIAQKAGEHYHEFDPDTWLTVEEGIEEFNEWPKEGKFDWAENNMNWEEVVKHAQRIEETVPVNYQEGWVNGEKEIVEK